MTVSGQPLIWVLKGLRAGDTAQALALSSRLDAQVVPKQLHFNAWHAVPNWLRGGSISHLNPETRLLLQPPWPDLVIATGRRTAAASVWIKQQSGGFTRIVQLGRPRMALSAFDLVVTTPQYGLPRARNVEVMDLPFATPREASGEDLAAFSQAWASLPRPWILGAIGGPKFPVRLGKAELGAFGRLLSGRANATGGSVIVIDSPRSPSHAVDAVGAAIDAPKWLYRRGQGANPYGAALQLCDELNVTSDSMSMVTDMLLTAKPTSIFRLPLSRLRPQWQAERGLGAVLASGGVLHPPRDVSRVLDRLVGEGFLGDMALGIAPRQTYQPARQQQAVVARVRSLLLP